MTRAVKHFAFFVTRTQESVLKNSEPSARVTKPLYLLCCCVGVFVKENSQPFTSVYTHLPRPSVFSFPTTLSLSTVLLSSLTFSRFHNTLFKVIPFSGVSTMSDGHWKPRSAAFQHRFISPHLPSGQSINTGARLLMLSLLTSFPWTSAPSLSSDQQYSPGPESIRFTPWGQKQQRNPPGLL